MTHSCACGETKIVYGMSVYAVERFPDEVGELHGASECGWGFECHDCLGFSSNALQGVWEWRTEARAALLDHLDNSCLVSQSTDYDSPRKRPRFIPASSVR